MLQTQQANPNQQNYPDAGQRELTALLEDLFRAAGRLESAVNAVGERTRSIAFYNVPAAPAPNGTTQPSQPLTVTKFGDQLMQLRMIIDSAADSLFRVEEAIQL